MHRFSRWKLSLSECQTIQEVVSLMANYVATIGPEDFEALPQSCRRALSVDDISGSAVVLIREELQFSGNGEVGEILHEIAHTFVAASHRIASIQARGQPVTRGSK